MSKFQRVLFIVLAIVLVAAVFAPVALGAGKGIQKVYCKKLWCVSYDLKGEKDGGTFYGAAILGGKQYHTRLKSWMFMTHPIRGSESYYYYSDLSFKKVK